MPTNFADILWEDAMTNIIVLIDSTEAAYTVFTAIPDQTSNELQQQYVSTPGMRFVTLAELRRQPERYMSIGEAHDQLPEQSVVETILETLGLNLGVPIGLTWNGGIAVTYNDYHYAQRLYEQRSG